MPDSISEPIGCFCLDYFWNKSSGGDAITRDADSQAHTWLQLDDIIIDIIGDQFEFYSLPLKNTNRVYVGKQMNFMNLLMYILQVFWNLENIYII